MSVDLGTDPMLMKQAPSVSASRSKKRSSKRGSRRNGEKGDVAARAWKRRQMRQIAQTWNTDLEDIQEAFRQPVVYGIFLKELLRSARCYPRNVLVPLIQEAREERSRGLRRADRSSGKGPAAANDAECFLPCDVTKALERAREALRESEVIWHPKGPPSVIKPKAEPMEEEGMFAPVTPNATQEHMAGVNGQKNTRDTPYQDKVGNVHQPRRENLECNGLTREASSQRGKNKDRNDESDDSDTVLIRPPKRRRHHGRLAAAAGAGSSTSKPHPESSSSEEDKGDGNHHHNQSDIEAAEAAVSNKASEGHSDPKPNPRPLKLTLASDPPKVLAVIQRIESDASLCPKMQWYVAQHVRAEHQPGLSPSRQTYRRRIGEHRRTSGGRSWAVGLPSRPFSRLDFEATRAQVGFVRDREGWGDRTITQILQEAYERYGWSEAIGEEEVDGVLLEAGADLTLWDDLESDGEDDRNAADAAHERRKKKGKGESPPVSTRTRTRQVTPPLTPAPDVHHHHQGPPREIIEIESSPEPSSPSYHPTNGALEDSSSWSSFMASSSDALSNNKPVVAKRGNGRTIAIDDDDAPLPVKPVLKGNSTSAPRGGVKPDNNNNNNNNNRRWLLPDGKEEWRREWPPPSQKQKNSSPQEQEQEQGGSSSSSSSSSNSNSKLTVLWAEVEALKTQAERDRLAKEMLIQEQKAAQEALLAEMRRMREAAEKERARCWNQNQKRLKKKRKNERRLRRYLRKLKELEAAVEEDEEEEEEEEETASSSSSSSSDEDRSHRMSTTSSE